MTDKILEAVKALGGDINNINSSDGDISNYVALCIRNSYDPVAISGEYWDVGSGCNQMVFEKICTAEEFNTAAAEWIKEAYMHNAAIDLGWNVNNSFHYDGEKYLFRNNDTGDYVDSDDDDDCGGGCTLICKSQEFVAYCAANKPQSQIETPEEKEALDMIEARQKADWNGEGLPPVGCKVVVINDKNYIASSFDELFIGNEVTLVSTFTNTEGVKMAAVSLDGGDCCCFMEDMVLPIKSPRYKAIEAITKATGFHEVPVGEFYDWLKSLTPEQKKEFGL